MTGSAALVPSVALHRLTLKHDNTLIGQDSAALAAVALPR